MESILTSIKKMLGITEEYEHFDSDLIIHINSVFMILTQLGVGPPSGFSVQDKSATWKEFISDETKLQLVKSYADEGKAPVRSAFEFRCNGVYGKDDC